MKKEDLKELEKKEVKIILKNNYEYNGRILDFLDEHLKFKDKFGALILISYDDIHFVKENRKKIEK